MIQRSLVGVILAVCIGVARAEPPSPATGSGLSASPVDLPTVVPAMGSQLPQDLGPTNQRVTQQVGQIGSAVGQSAVAVAERALDFLGVRYRRGGTTEQSGFDCSGLVRNVYAQTVGLILPHSAKEQAADTQKIDPAELKPGDLVFFNTMRRAFSHVGIYLGNGEFIHAPKPGAHVRVERMDVAYWKRRFNGARRVLTGQSDTGDTRTSRQP
ncbi:MAG: C40 family peptidase [Rhodoferax sp.]